MPQGLKARLHFCALMPGLKPRPTFSKHATPQIHETRAGSVLGFAGAEVFCSVCQRMRAKPALQMA